MKYVVVCVVDREIYRLGVADTPSGATEILKNDSTNAFFDDGGTEDDFNEGNGRGSDWEYSATEAWLNGRHSKNFDWRILEVE